MKKIVVAMVAALGAFVAFAGNPSAALISAADEMQMECPIEAMPGWVVQAVSVDKDATTVTVIVADGTFYGVDADTLKAGMMQYLSRVPSGKGSLLYETVQSGLNFQADMISAGGDKTVEVVLTADELANALK